MDTGLRLKAVDVAARDSRVAVEYFILDWLDWLWM